jgi:hypothetical protein
MIIFGDKKIFGVLLKKENKQTSWKYQKTKH